MANGGPSKKVYSGRPSESFRLVWNASISLQNAITFSSSFGKSKGAVTGLLLISDMRGYSSSTDYHEVEAAFWIPQQDERWCSDYPSVTREIKFKYFRQALNNINILNLNLAIESNWLVAGVSTLLTDSAFIYHLSTPVVIPWILTISDLQLQDDSSYRRSDESAKPNDNVTSCSWMPTTLCTAKVSYKKTQGVLELTDTHLQWTQNGQKAPSVRVPHAETSC